MEPARVEVAREAAGLFWIGSFFEGLDQVGFAPRDGGAARVDGRLWLAVPRALNQLADPGGDFLETAPLEPELAVDGHD